MKDIMIAEINVTTVCYSYSYSYGYYNNSYYCYCDDPYSWSCDKCRSYGYCSPFVNTSCSCSGYAQYDGQFCQPKAELNTSLACLPIVTTDYLFEIEADTVDLSNLYLLQNYFNYGMNYAQFYTVSNITIFELNITTVCLWNDASFQCMCQNQYFWPYDKCRRYGFCDDLTNTSCGCINGFPDDGQFCQPFSELNISTAPTTTTTAPTTTTTSPTTTTTAPTTTTTSPTTITTEPTTTTTEPTTITPTTTITTTPSTTKNKKKLSLSLKINEDFHLDLTDKNSQKYKKYEADIKKSIDESYSGVAGYEKGSAEVTGFRPGSVFADFSISATSDYLDLVLANKQLSSNLSALGYTVNSDSFMRSVQGTLSNGQIFPGETLILNCTITDSNISWTKDVTVLTSSDKYVISGSTLSVTKASSDDSGTYSCMTTWNSIPYMVWESITIPEPNLQLTYSKVVKCEDTKVRMLCCESSYSVMWNMDNSVCTTVASDQIGCISSDCVIKKQDCQAADQNILVKCELKRGGYSNKSTITTTTKSFKCFDDTFGGGDELEKHSAICGGGTTGNKTAQCNSSGKWDIIENNCVLRDIQLLKDRSENLNVTSLPQFVTDLKNASESNAANITESPATIVAIVEILQTVASTAQSISVNKPIMQDFLQTVDIIGSAAVDTWEGLNSNSKTTNTSSALLKSVEDMAQRLSKETINITTNLIQLSRTNSTGSYLESFRKNTTHVHIPVIAKETFITVIVFTSFDNILPVRTSGGNQQGAVINGDIAVVQTNIKVDNLSLSYSVLNENLVDPQCVFWNFKQLNSLGGWDTTGCRVKPIANQIGYVTCECDHTTSFSMLMSPYFVGSDALDIISYVFLGISMGSLILCLIIEIIIWKTVTRNDTSYLRHVAIVNIAVSLLIACIWFIVGAGIVKPGVATPVGSCSAATFFTHFFFLAVFFWMLISALFLLYRTIVVFSRISRAKLMAISFTVGYGAPLLITVITVASTAGNGGYIQENNYCWLNWSKTKALLAFVIPVITIVVINLLVLVVVLFKILRRGVNNASTQPDEKHALVVIAKCVGILSPLFGLTWGFGIGTMVSLNFGIHVVFVVLTSLQGFFILVFGLLVDSKVRETLAGKFSLRSLSSNLTKSTSGGHSSSVGLTFFQRLRRRQVYHVSEGDRILSSASTNTVTNN